MGFVFCIELLGVGIGRFSLQIVVGLEAILVIAEAIVNQKLDVECDIQEQIIPKPKKVFRDSPGLHCSQSTQTQ